uniref:Uncharacterized protein n=1 Tax=Romanomermis culicivorax TaxID=13658 RepID=A0A915J273_ROMCU
MHVKNFLGNGPWTFCRWVIERGRAKNSPVCKGVQQPRKSGKVREKVVAGKPGKVKEIRFIDGYHSNETDFSAVVSTKLIENG